ncbi:IS66 family insertion sequence element accessory protein TnpA [Sorangium sp. So ce375]|uniref:IS66 family insertion sequence element accessory protein TnpA n=1 Tax=Sorangium sp. So ce375 TaxID=3133306 RepID=UPI003F5C9F33
MERWERCGLSAEKFARREGYKPKQVYWWRWKLRAEGASRPLILLCSRGLRLPATPTRPERRRARSSCWG